MKRNNIPNDEQQPPKKQKLEEFLNEQLTNIEQLSPLYDALFSSLQTAQEEIYALYDVPNFIGEGRRLGAFQRIHNPASDYEHLEKIFNDAKLMVSFDAYIHQALECGLDVASLETVFSRVKTLGEIDSAIKLVHTYFCMYLIPAVKRFQYFQVEHPSLPKPEEEMKFEPYQIPQTPSFKFFTRFNGKLVELDQDLQVIEDEPKSTFQPS